MKRILPLLPLLVLACTAAQASDAPAVAKPLPYAECIRTSEINEWHVVDARTALVRTGPDRYLVKLQADCPRLGIGAPGLLFRASESGKAVGGSRICGGVGETVSARDQPPCAISSVRKIDKAKFESLRKHAARHGSGADQPTKPINP
ncbi:hypothetical protein ASG87_14855 [Frateuria sp. Soil773]|uniref:DUF6491 family protein n=1 Tax=Frateuria sp. Soil773 TaxID=1736407 RepID=UPI0006F7CB39|nr:DUF6491 family protein [Frateuria sp. Soil773]KRE97803.1 hypothetical protein ASG87_14855 [Frateuria sp. Soil773]